MPRTVIGGLIQAGRRPLTDPAAPIDEGPSGGDRRAPAAHRGGRAAAASRSSACRRSSTARTSARRRTRTGTTSPSRCRGPTTELMAQHREEVRMAMVVPVYEREQAGRLLQHRRGLRRRRHVPRQVPQEPHPAHVRVLGEVLLQAGQPRLSGVQDAVREDRRLHLLRPPLPRGRAAPRPERRRDRVQPVGDRRRAVAVPLEARAAGARRRQRLLHGAAATASAPRRRGTSAGSTARPTSSIRAATSSRRRSEDKDELVVAEMDLDMIEEVRRVWQFYRDRRPETLRRAWRSSVP